MIRGNEILVDHDIINNGKIHKLSQDQIKCINNLLVEYLTNNSFHNTEYMFVRQSKDDNKNNLEYNYNIDFNL